MPVITFLITNFLFFIYIQLQTKAETVMIKEISPLKNNIAFHLKYNIVDNYYSHQPTFSFIMTHTQ